MPDEITVQSEVTILGLPGIWMVTSIYDGGYTCTPVTPDAYRAGWRNFVADLSSLTLVPSDRATK